MDIVKGIQAASSPKGLPPVEKWNPPSCGDIGMRIARDGQWYYQGSPIGRKKLVRLFSTVLRHDKDGVHYLVTPVEKVPVEVEDAPFVAVEMNVSGEGREQSLSFRTNVDDVAVAGADHKLRCEINSATEEPSPYIHVRGRLEALIARAVFYDLVALGVQEGGAFGVWSQGIFFPLAPSLSLYDR